MKTIFCLECGKPTYHHTENFLGEKHPIKCLVCGRTDKHMHVSPDSVFSGVDNQLENSVKNNFRGHEHNV